MRIKIPLALALLNLIPVAGWAQDGDFNPDGTATMRRQCLESGTCDSGGYSGGQGGSDPLTDALIDLWFDRSEQGSTRRQPTGSNVTAYVIDIPDNDVLNIRQGPGTEYPVVAGIPPNGRDIAVNEAKCVRRDGYKYDWCPVNYRGAIGWAYAGYLHEQK